MTDLDTTDASDLREQFERDGFVVLPDFVDPSACDALKARANDLVAGFEPDATVRSIFSTNEQTRTTDDYFLGSGDDIRFFFEEEAFGPDGELNQPLELSINKFGHAQHDLDPVFDSFSRSPELADVADRLGFGGHVLVQSMYIFKQPHIGGEVTCHNDHTFIWTDPVSCIGLWFAIEDATIDNGCLWALPGGHRIPVKQRFRREGTGTGFEVFDDTPYPTEGLVSLEATKGTVIVLDGRLPHLSGANRSDHSRHAYTLHVVDPSADYPADNWLQRPDLPLRGFRG
ncbi:MAG TPA: phytanoyl-CoA dioxygenase family protein [Microthrixaceae bacterium]|nr:phytanoyl-CoA dioxygenase family protein [Microthrixaceae bacterium]